MDMKAAGFLGACIIVAALILAIVPGRHPTTPAATPPAQRYQFAQGNDNLVFVLDTQTGRLWRRFIEKAGPVDWSEDKGPWLDPASK